MAHRIRTGDPHGFNKGRGSMFRGGSQPREEDRRKYRPKRFGNNDKDKDNSPKTLNDKNHQASSQKFGQLKMKTIVQKLLMMNITKLRLRSLDNEKY